MASNQHHRRDFVRALALGGLAAPATLRADETPKDKKEAPAPEPPKSEADARMELVLARFGKHLDAESRKSVRREIEVIVHRAEALRKFKLDNGDGPCPVFMPYREL